MEGPAGPSMAVGEGFQRKPPRNRFPLAAFFPRFLSPLERNRAPGGIPVYLSALAFHVIRIPSSRSSTRSISSAVISPVSMSWR